MSKKWKIYQPAQSSVVEVVRNWFSTFFLDKPKNSDPCLVLTVNGKVALHTEESELEMSMKREHQYANGNSIIQASLTQLVVSTAQTVREKL